MAVGIGTTIVLVLAGTAAQLINYAFHLHVDALDSSGDGGAFGVVGDVTLASAALAAWCLLGRVRPRHPAVVALPVLLSFLAVDKALRLHEEIAGWPLYYVPVVVATGVSLVLVGQRLSGRSMRLLIVGLALLIVAFVIHFTGETALDMLGASGSGWASQLKAVIKHGAEVAGWLIVAFGLILGARGRAGHSTRVSRLEVAPTSRVTAG